MDDQECNRIIAEFMGYYVHKTKIVTSVRFGRVNGSFVGDLYTLSLDALVPVWEKLNCGTEYLPQGNGCTFAIFTGDNNPWSRGETIQQAAAHATCKAIQELAK